MSEQTAFERQVALAHARRLAEQGVRLFIARPALDDTGHWLPEGGTRGCGYWLPKSWQTKAAADPAVVDAWKPGEALCAVMGDVVDAVDVDPRNGGSWPDDVMPTVYGVASTPSGGTHALVKTLGVRTKQGFLPGVDLQAGVGGEGCGFIFLAPTRKRSKVDKEIGVYAWTTAPDLSSLNGHDDSGDRLKALIEKPESGLTHLQRAVAEAAVFDSVIETSLFLAETVTLLPDEGDRDEKQRGWEERCRDAAYALACLAAADWSPFTAQDAAAAFEAMLPMEMRDDPNLTGKVERPDALVAKAIAKGDARPAPWDPPKPNSAKGDALYRERYKWHLADARARRDALATLSGEQFVDLQPVIRSAAEVMAAEPIEAVIEQILAAEVNLLGGPAEGGKSLIARDWALAVATGTPWRGFIVPQERHVLWVASEGMHDARERWQTMPLYEKAEPRLAFLETPVNLVNGTGLEWLLDVYAGKEKPGLIVFDLIYAMGLTDDDGAKDVMPLIASLKKLSAEWRAATVAIGHSKHDNRDRRFRGSSVWRQQSAVEWHLADGLASCERSKLADKTPLSWGYQLKYPYIDWLDPAQVLSQKADRNAFIAGWLDREPDMSVLGLAKILAPKMNVSERQAERLIAKVKQTRDDFVGGST
jgi:hypothetical protein